MGFVHRVALFMLLKMSFRVRNRAPETKSLRKRRGHLYRGMSQADAKITIKFGHVFPLKLPLGVNFAIQYDVFCTIRCTVAMFLYGYYGTEVSSCTMRWIAVVDNVAGHASVACGKNTYQQSEKCLRHPG